MASLCKNLCKYKSLYGIFKCNLSTQQHQPKLIPRHPEYINFCKAWAPEYNEMSNNLCRDMTVTHDFLSDAEETCLFKEIEPYLMRMRYEFDHWDDAIHGFRETERLNWNAENNIIIDRLRKLAFPKEVAQLKQVHVLDLAAKGYIKPHIDAVRFCGNIIAGMSLLSDSVMRLVHDKEKQLYVDILLKRKSLYIMRDTARYEYTHEILPNERSMFKTMKVPRDRRISIICRNEPV